MAQRYGSAAVPRLLAPPRPYRCPCRCSGPARRWPVPDLRGHQAHAGRTAPRGQTGLDGIDAQPRQLLGDDQLFAHFQAGARRLLPVARSWYEIQAYPRDMLLPLKLWLLCLRPIAGGSPLAMPAGSCNHRKKPVCSVSTSDDQAAPHPEPAIFSASSSCRAAARPPVRSARPA